MLNADVIYTCPEREHTPIQRHAAKIVKCNADGTHNVIAFHDDGSGFFPALNVKNCEQLSPGTFAYMEQYAEAMENKQA